MSDMPSIPALPEVPTPDDQEEAGLTQGQKIVVYVIVAVVVVGLGALVWWFTAHMLSNPAQASTWRDIFIIFMAVESLVIGFALVILMVQLAVLTNMLQHEIKPILESTNETVNTVRGTAIFVSENLVDPIVKLNSYVAGLSRVVEVINSLTQLGRKK